MDVVRDLLDKPVVDRNGREMGRVDGILLERRADEPLRVRAILIGPVVLGNRLHPAIGRLVSRTEQWLRLDARRPTGIDVADIEDFDDKVRLRLTIGETAVAAVEQRLRNWVSRLPGAR